MHFVVLLMVAAAAVCAIARPSGTLSDPEEEQQDGGFGNIISDFYLPRILMPQYLGYVSNPILSYPGDEWLNKEIYRINLMGEEQDSRAPYENDLDQIIAQDQYLNQIVKSLPQLDESYIPEPPKYYTSTLPPSVFVEANLLTTPTPLEKKEVESKPPKNDNWENFALTPEDKEYFENITKETIPISSYPIGHQEGGGQKKSDPEIRPQRQIRQNPNLSKTKNLVSENLDRLRAGLSQGKGGSTEKPGSIRQLENAPIDPADSIYGVAIITAIGGAISLAIVALAFAWYTMSKRAKAAADVDYPAYGVTGPSADLTGDRKLAHSAHMYHYQHQKQQIIAMERSGMDLRNGSVSDPESEEENEEGDYTVYECPGFATTGEMEVKNPLFNEDPTPATPGKCEIVKPQPKE